MANPQTKSYDGKMSENLLVLGSTGTGKTTLVQEMRENSVFGKPEVDYWISKVELSKQREAEMHPSFKAVVDFYNLQDEFDLKKTFNDLENLYQEKVEKQKIINQENHGKGEYVERNYLIVLDDISGLADRSPSFITFMTTSRKFEYSLFYVFHETEISSPRWKDISQTQIFCVFPSVIDLVLNHLVKFVTRNGV